MTRRWGLASLVIAAVFASGESALAQDSTNDPPLPTATVAQVPVDQYIEEVPTAGGSKPSGRSGGESSSQESSVLAPSVAEELDGQNERDGAKLKKIATSPAYGAPQRPSDIWSSNGSQSARSESGAAEAVESAFEGEGGGLLGGLLIAMAVIAGVAAAAAVWRARRGRSSPARERN